MATALLPHMLAPRRRTPRITVAATNDLHSRALAHARLNRRPFRESAYLIRRRPHDAKVNARYLRAMHAQPAQKVDEHTAASISVIKDTYRMLENHYNAPLVKQARHFGEQTMDGWEVPLEGLATAYGDSSLAGNLNSQMRSFLTGRSWRRKVFQLFEEPQSSVLAFVLQVYILSLILLSSVCFTLDTVASLQDMSLWDDLEIFLVTNFTLEYVIRFATCPDRGRFVFEIFNVIDLFAILPFYLELVLSVAGQGIAPVRIVRLARGFRLLKIGRRSHLVNNFGSALVLTKEAIVLLLVIYSFITILWASVEFYAETSQASIVNDEYIYDSMHADSSGTLFNRTDFQSTISALWWAIVTETGVGYGDMVPVTGPGKAVAGVVIAMTVITLALPITLIGENIRDEFRAMLRSGSTCISDEDMCLNGRDPLLPPNPSSEFDDHVDRPLPKLLDPRTLYEMYTELKNQAVHTVPDLETVFERTMHSTEQIHETLDTLEHIADEIRAQYTGTSWDSLSDSDSDYE